MTTMQSTLPTAGELRDRARLALQAIGADLIEAENGVAAGTPITGDVLFTVADTPVAEAHSAIAAAAEAFATWRTTPPAPVRGQVVARSVSCSSSTKPISPPW